MGGRAGEGLVVSGAGRIEGVWLTVEGRAGDDDPKGSAECACARTDGG